MNNDEEEAIRLVKHQNDIVEKEVEELRKSKQGRSGNIFKIKKLIKGSKTGGLE